MSHNIGPMISARRKQLRLTQVELGKRSGIGQDEISRIENGRAYCGAARLRRLALALEVAI